MPGKKPTKLKPAEFLVVGEHQMPGAFGAAPAKQPKIEAFPLVDDQSSPSWVNIPKRKTVKEVETFGLLPQGAQPMPLFDPTGPAQMRSIHPSGTARARLLLVGEGF